MAAGGRDEKIASFQEPELKKKAIRRGMLSRRCSRLHITSDCAKPFGSREVIHRSCPLPHSPKLRNLSGGSCLLQARLEHAHGLSEGPRGKPEHKPKLMSAALLPLRLKTQAKKANTAAPSPRSNLGTDVNRVNQPKSGRTSNVPALRPSGAKQLGPPTPALLFQQSEVTTHRSCLPPKLLHTSPLKNHHSCPKKREDGLQGALSPSESRILPQERFPQGLISWLKAAQMLLYRNSANARGWRPSWPFRPPRLCSPQLLTTFH